MSMIADIRQTQQPIDSKLRRFIFRLLKKNRDKFEECLTNYSIPLFLPYRKPKANPDRLG